MKISFKVDLRTPEKYKMVRNEEKLSDLFLVLLPRKFEMNLIKSLSYTITYEIKLELDRVLSLQDISEKLRKLGVEMTNFRQIKREFTKKELEEVRKRVCFREILEPSEIKE